MLFACIHFNCELTISTAILGQKSEGNPANEKTNPNRDLSFSNMRDLLSAHYKLLLAAFSFATRGHAFKLPNTYDFAIYHKQKQKQPSELKSEIKENCCFSEIFQACAKSLISTLGLHEYELSEVERCPSLSLSAEILRNNLIPMLEHCKD